MSEGQVRRYFVGLVGFGFVACVAAIGVTAAIAALAACGLIVVGPELLRRRRPVTARRRNLRSRPLAEEGPEELPLVPDDPSLVIELG
jgi:hypothetical protein